MSRPVLLLDMDGPLADFDRHVIETTTALLDIDWPVTPETFRHRFSIDHLPKSEASRVRRWVNTQMRFAELPVTAGAVAGVAGLLEAFDVWVCSKPLEANARCASDKHWWIQTHFRELANRVILAPDKSMIHGHVLLDDAIKLDWVGRASWFPVVFPMSFNGAGSAWTGLERWGWGDPPVRLLELARRQMKVRAA